jgi:dienelactone hydrolase
LTRALAILPVMVVALLPSIAPARQRAEAKARFELPHDDVLIDETIPIVVSGLPPRAEVTLRLHSGGQAEQWTSSATFTADEAGRIDVTRMAPVKPKGSYKEADAMGLFWSAERASAARPDASDEDVDGSSPESWTLTAETGGGVVARATVRRRAVAADVRVKRVRESGLVGTLYEPADAARHPAFIVLGGSGGGVPPPVGPAGGLASRGYAVLALAYFGAEGLPGSLSNIPLEYFGTALQWLAAQPSVDSTRIGVLGASRGGELALLLGAVYPAIRLVVAYVPSNVVWRGCCDPSAQFAWTIGGRPLAAMSPLARRQPLEAQQAEIPVEKIHGAVLLISGRDDGVWPSAEMAEKAMARLRRNNFAYPSLSLAYDHAGHGITRPHTSTMELNSRRHPISGRLVQMGGTPAGTARAREDSWRQLLTFVDQHLRAAAPAGEPREHVFLKH